MADESGKDGQDNGGEQKPQPAPAIDLSKLTDDEFSKIYDDPRLYNHKRFKDLNERAKKASEYEAEKAKQEEENLKKQGEFEKLAKQKEEEATALKKQLNDTKIDNQIANIAQSLGAIDLDTVTKLVDRSSIKVNDDGVVEGVKEAVETLLKEKVFLFNVKAPKVGGGTNPKDGEVTEFTMTQIADPAFYQANRDAILRAQAAGKIKNDRQY